MEARNRRTIRSATLVGFPDAARAVGLDPAKMLASVGLDIACMEDLETQISFDAFLKLLAECARASGCPDFATRAAIQRGVPNLGEVTLLMREAETVEQAINFYTSHLTLHADGTFIQLDKRFQNPLVVIEISARTREESFQCTQYALVGVTMLVRWLLGEDFQPDMIALAFAKPANMRAFQRFFKCPVQYKQVLSGLVINESILQRTPVTSSPFLRRLAMQQLNPIMKRSVASFSNKVERQIRKMLDEGSCDAESLAAHFNMDRRTMSRHLSNEGATFSRILQCVRADIASRALAETSSSLAMIADQTGFESLSSFSRWFHGTFGCSATQWRSQQAAQDSAETGTIKTLDKQR